MTSSNTNTEIRAIEFFSGIGGLHYGFKHTGAPGDVVAAYDVNQVANTVYAHNFPATALSTASIEHLSLADVERYRANAWFLSPPCQPFTRGGKCLDHEDDRSRGLLHLVALLERMAVPPRYLFLENVKNFETSECRRILVDALDRRGYAIAECLLEPTHLGIPNARLRYFLMARRRADDLPAAPVAADEAESEPTPLYSERGVIQTTWPVVWSPSSSPTSSDNPAVEVAALSSYFDVEVDETCLVPEAWIRKSHKFNFDVVSSNATRSSTFTKAYGSRHIFGSGSFLVSELLPAGGSQLISDVDRMVQLRPRFFSPAEVARLHCFPDSLTFPKSVSRAQQYRLLGNSLNAQLVGELMKILFDDVIA
ncbi:hypothetical protein H9P43_007284 [Blastocladiella emersonii ATCC 22665]|nr:hypothetical protein H9P43_007284 [Blastocladiella emersonii ATCC 22665]